MDRGVACAACPPLSANPADATLGDVTERDVTDLVQVYSATPTRESALALVQSTVESRLAAGGQVYGPVTAAFWHNGEFGTGEEWQLVLKTSTERYPQLEKHLTEHHPWTNPEIIAVPIAAAPAQYVAWVRAATAPE